MPYGKDCKQGRFVPRNPSKYVGDVNNIRYKSSWENDFCRFLDNNPNIIRWGYEPFPIKYLKPTTNRIHRYYVDFYVEYRNKAGKLIQELIEVKPANQTRISKSKRTKTRFNENLTYAINEAKWNSAKQFCLARGWNFRLVTENQLYPTGKRPKITRKK